MVTSELVRRLGLEHPILQAPMAGGPTTPALAAAVSAAGGLGALGEAYVSPAQILADAAAIRALTDRPFALNLFAGGHEPAPPELDVAPALAVVARAHAALGLAPPAPPARPADSLPAQLDAVLEARPALFSFTFGVPPAEALARIRERGILVAGTATTADEAAALEAAGVDAVIAQGSEAGGHRGTFLGAFEASMVPTAELVAACIARVRLPVIASGGIMDGRDAAAMLTRGAAAVQLGTAFLACPESGASPAFKRAVLAARGDPTVVTRAYSGRPARGIANAFIAEAEEEPGAILPYPLQNVLTRAMRAEAARRGDAERLSLWAGQGVARARAMPAGELVRTIARELAEAARRD